jgi:hypothetical protein
MWTEKKPTANYTRELIHNERFGAMLSVPGIACYNPPHL